MSHPQFNLPPSTMSNMYLQAMQRAGHKAKGWHSPDMNDTLVLTEEGKVIRCSMNAQSQVVLSEVTHTG